MSRCPLWHESDPSPAQESGTERPTPFRRSPLQQTPAEETQLAAVAIGDPESKHGSLGLLGFLAGMDEDYPTCQYLDQKLGKERFLV